MSMDIYPLEWEVQKQREFLAHIAADFGVAPERASFVEDIPKGMNFQVLCDCEWFRDPSTRIDDPGFARLVAMKFPYIQVDNLLGIKTDFLVGVCENCKRVYAGKVENQR